MTRLVRTLALTVTFTTAAVTAAGAQRGGVGGGGLPRLVGAPAAPVRPMPALPRGGGIMAVPRAASAHPGARPGDLPRIVSGFPRGGGFGVPGFSHRRSRFLPAPHTRGRVRAGCIFGCQPFGGFIGHKGRFTSGFFGDFPFAFPFFFPLAYDAGYATYPPYTELPEDVGYAEPRRAASKLIVVGAGGRGGEALTVETIADSVRLTWLGAGRPAREVRLFVADSAHRELAARSANPSAPTATFEISTLSAPVAFTGVTIEFADGVTATTVVPYRLGGVSGQRR